MGKSLIIVESPAKARTITKYLGRGYTVVPSIGHVKDLPTSKFGVDVERDFAPQYVVIRRKDRNQGQILAEIKKQARTADKIFIATDPDREGEMIAWHIAEELNGKRHVYRVLFNEITQSAIKRALQAPGQIDLKKVNAQQARRVLDRIVGYKLSPLLWDKVRRGLSAGRVQSVAVRLIVDREKERDEFESKEYWTITAHLRGSQPPPFEAKLQQVNGERAELHTEAQTQEVLRTLDGASYTVAAIDRKEKRRNPLAPFITSRMQQEAARKLRFAPKKTMLVAQQLYEGVDLGKEGPTGLITYMRTDSTRVSAEAVAEARELIASRFGAAYVPETPNVYKSKKEAQEAHEAIRPTAVARDPERIKTYLERDQYLLYKLIYDRFVSSQMTPALLEVTGIDISAGPHLFRATGTVVKFPGYTVLYSESKMNGDQTSSDEAAPVQIERDEGEESRQLPPLQVGERLTLEPGEGQGLVPKQHFTQPPPRYNEALLIKELEDKGIGRPSTYAQIISTIQERRYVEKEDGRFKPTPLGGAVNDRLVAYFPDVFDVGFTARMEEELDEIEDGDKNWVATVRDFYDPFMQDLNKAERKMEGLKGKEEPTDIVCDKCGRKMVIKWGRHGHFLACPGYPECKNTKEFVRNEAGEIQVIERPAEITDEKCEKCGSPMALKTSRYGKFLACSAYPQCKFTKPIPIGVKCPRDAGELTQKRTKKGRTFYACANYPQCDFAVWDRPVNTPCPKCGASFLVEKYSKQAGASLQCLTCEYKHTG